MNTCIPWWGRITAKLLLSRLPLPYKYWRKIGIFEHGDMLKASYSLRVFTRHWEHSLPYFQTPPRTLLELGPGDSLASALIGAAYGIQKSVLVDLAHFAQVSPKHLLELTHTLREQGKSPPEIHEKISEEEFLNICHAQYLTEGLSSLRTLPSQSCDLILSQAVLEHIRLQEIDELLGELRRILRPGGIASHRIDLKDHLGGSLNNLRFSEKIWEQDAFAFRSGFYTNRVRAGEWERRFQAAGFEIVMIRKESWQELPLQKSKLAIPFADLPVEELRVSGMDVVLRG